MQTNKLEDMGTNMVKVFGRLKRQLDPEPTLVKNGYPSEEWVQWYMRQTNCERRIAVNRGYALLDFEGDKEHTAFDLITMKPFEFDEGLKIFGVNRMKDYFGTAGAALSQLVKHNARRKQL